MEETIRISTTLDGEDKYVTVNVEQSFDQLEILSLTIDQEDIYTLFNSDVGVVVGRVIANGGVGVPNAKVCVFIPIDDEDTSRTEIFERYPFTNTRDTGPGNKRFNLLPSYREYTPKALDNVRGVFQNRFGVGLFPKTPVGTFPTRLDVVTNNTVREVYEKYYKYSTTTNESGDYILYGIPVGVQTFHLDVDLSDIGPYSITPADLIAQGYSSNLFNSGTFGPCEDLDTCIQVESQDLTTDVRPLWGDSGTFQIGITRLDFNLRKQIRPSFTFYSSVLTMNRSNLWGDVTTSRRLIRSNGTSRTVGYESSNYSRIQGGSVNLDHNGTANVGTVNIDTFTPLDSFYGARCTNGGTSTNFGDAPLTGETSGFTFDLTKASKLFIGTFENLNVKVSVVSAPLEKDSESFQVPPEEIQFFSEPGQFVVRVPCNKTKKITNEFGVLVDSPNDEIGIFTQFEGFFLVDIVEPPEQPKSDDIAFRCSIKIPASDTSGEQASPFGVTLESKSAEIFYSENILFSKLKEQYSLFEFGKYYTCAQRLGNNLDRINNKYGRNTLSIDTSSNSGRDVSVPLNNCSFIDRVGAIELRSQNVFFTETVELTRNNSNNTTNIDFTTYGQLYDVFVNMTMFTPNFTYRQTTDSGTPVRYSPYAALRIENVGSLEWTSGIPVEEFILNPIQFETKIVETPIEDIIRFLEMSLDNNLTNIALNKSTNATFFNINEFNNVVLDSKNGFQSAKRKKLFGNYVTSDGKNKNDITIPLENDRFYFFLGLGEANVLRFLLLKQFI